MAFHVGQRVVCICSEGNQVSAVLVKGSIYTVRKAQVEGGFSPFGNEPHLCLHFDELVHPLNPNWGFDSRRFRPVRETSIECFKQYLAPTPVEGEMA